MIPAWWNDIKYFKPEEFDSPDMPGSGAERMDPEFIRLLDQIRAGVGHPLPITSGFRTQAHNAKVGGKSSSAHRGGLAADIKAITSAVRYDIVKIALQYGTKRIGIGDTFVHLDIHPTLPQNVIWLY